MSRPLCIELYAGLHGWGEGFLTEGYRVIGFDIVDVCAMLGRPRPEGIDLVLQDVLTIDGRKLKDATVIVGSSPCQEFSYRAMPWRRAKELPPPNLGIQLFNAQFFIQREASEAAGRYIPLVAENVKGAQPWIGRAAWHYGSYYLWGDVPAIMPFAGGVRKALATIGHMAHGTWFGVSHGQKYDWREQNPRDGQQHGIKVPAMNWSDRNRAPQGFNTEAARRFREGIKQRGSGPEWFDSGLCKQSSRSDSRKAASAMIAKIPFVLAQHVARTFKP